MTRGERIREWLSSIRLGDTRVMAALAVVLAIVVAGVAFTLLSGGDEEAGGKGKGRTAGRAVAQVQPSEIEVTVLNGTSVTGLADTFGDKVEAKGFKLGAIGNSPSSFEQSVVMYKRGNAPEARRVGRALGIPEKAVMSSEVAAVSAGAGVSVVVGEDNASAAG